MANSYNSVKEVATTKNAVTAPKIISTFRRQK